MKYYVCNLKYVISRCQNLAGLFIFELRSFHFYHLFLEFEFLTENVVREIVNTCQNESKYSQLVRTLLEVFSKADTLAKSFLKVENSSEIINLSKEEFIGLDKEQVNLFISLIIFFCLKKVNNLK